MTTTGLVLSALNTVQVVALAWIAAWQQRTSRHVQHLDAVVHRATGSMPVAAPPGA